MYNSIFKGNGENRHLKQNQLYNLLLFCLVRWWFHTYMIELALFATNTFLLKTHVTYNMTRILKFLYYLLILKNNYGWLVAVYEHMVRSLPGSMFLIPNFKAHHCKRISFWVLYHNTVCYLKNFNFKCSVLTQPTNLPSLKFQEDSGGCVTLLWCKNGNHVNIPILCHPVGAYPLLLAYKCASEELAL
jgi:hypothetical protein